MHSNFFRTMGSHGVSLRRLVSGDSADRTPGPMSPDLAAVAHHAPPPEDLPGYYHPAHYPMWLISIPELLALDRMRPHQELLGAGKLVRWRPGRGRGTEGWQGGVIFVSHQWLGFRDPDPDGAQLRDLQGILRRLMTGGCGRVGPNWKLKWVLGDRTGVSASEWREALPGMRVWVDYFSIPQPTAGPMPPVPSDGAPGIPRRTPAPGPVVEELLVRAVRSIPAYIERSGLMIVLAPTAWHRDASAVCDYASWRGRGWCRMELACALLAAEPIRVLLVRGMHAAPEFISPVDALFLGAPLGRFSFDRDAAAVAGVVRRMLDGKEEACRRLKGVDGVFQRRFFVCIRHWFVRGGGSEAVNGGGRSKDDVDGAVAALKSRLEWADDGTEKRRERRLGINLVFWAALDDNLPALRALLSSDKGGGRGEGGGPPRRRRRRPRRPIDQRTRRAIPGTLPPGTTPLIAAMSFARFGVVEALLDAGADPTRMDGVGLEPFMWACAYGRAGNVSSWLARFPKWDLERPDRIAGNTALGIAVSQGADKLPVVRALLDAGADAGVRAGPGMNVLAMNALSPDADAELLAHFFEACPALRGAVDARARGRTAPWRAVMRLSELALRAGSSDAFCRYASSWRGGTALHMAAASGSVAVSDLLVAHGADCGLRNARRCSPMDVARSTFGTVPPLLERALTKTTVADLPTKPAGTDRDGEKRRRRRSTKGTDTVGSS